MNGKFRRSNFCMRVALMLWLLSFPLLCVGQQANEKAVGKTIEQFYSLLSFSDTLSTKLDSLESLFTSDGRLVANFGKKPLVFTVEEYVAGLRNSIRSGQLYSSTERELARQVDVFGKIAHVLSTYELTMVGKDGTIVRRGLNSIQLLKQDNKWLIYSLIWDREGNDLTLPSKYVSPNRTSSGKNE